MSNACLFFECFPYVCPEPVLVIFSIKWRNKTRFLTKLDHRNIDTARFKLLQALDLIASIGLHHVQINNADGKLPRCGPSSGGKLCPFCGWNLFIAVVFAARNRQ